MIKLKRILSTTFAIAALAWPGLAPAQSGFSEQAAAEAAFREGAKAFDEGNLAEACEKFEASQQLDPALGTTLRLADCYDRIGRTASAWAAFQQAAAMARQQAQPEREEIANERAEDLYERLTYLTLDVSGDTSDLDGVEILLDDKNIPAATWKTRIPVDPGVHVIMARAPGYEEWTTEIDVPETPGEESAASVPALVLRVEEEEEEKDDEPVAKEPAYAPTTPESSSDETASSTQRILAYTSGALGIAALGAGGYFAYRAHKLHQQSLEHCLAGAGNSCTTRGKEIRDDALEKGNYATIAAAAGLSLVSASVVLLLTEPSEQGTASAGSVTLTAAASARSAGVELGGTW